MNAPDAPLYPSPACRRYARRGYKRVSGWLTDVAVWEFVYLSQAQRRLGVSGPICEIGVHLGKTFVLLHLLTTPSESAVAFDLYELQNERVGRERKRQLHANLRRHGAALERVQVVTADSQTLTAPAVIERCGGHPRLISIDAGRSADLIYHDVKLARDALREGGLLCVTDYFQEAWPEVSEGVCRFMSTHGGLHPVVIGGNKFFFSTSRAFAQRYQERLRDVPRLQLRASTAYGEPVLIARAATLKAVLRRTQAWTALRHTKLGSLLRYVGQHLR